MRTATDGRLLPISLGLPSRLEKGGTSKVSMQTHFCAWPRITERILRMEYSIGEFVVEGRPLVSVANPDILDDAMTTKVNALYVISRQRTVEYDVAFGIRQIVDIAMKALSPGINDTTTAVMCVDYLTRDPGPTCEPPDCGHPPPGPWNVGPDSKRPELRELFC